ncbi:hypothetical protein [Martelella alba]|uniref:TonB C-terminal domain-containing protein n=1 Tax=Martelella alba TaxID=2590451 RepID=A0ABY2SDT9_9HYPH|nr:hypothetical protein [Martelella alba]TKI02762.1 hypothetical protein FCN80_23985 [Martelella alba]
MMIKILVFLCVGLFSFSTLSRELTQEERKAVENTIRNEMKDPDSAKFYHWDFPYPDKSSIYCGLVNGKNSYGAYAGKQLFVTFVVKNNEGEIVALSFDINESTGEPVNPDAISSLCASGGYDIPVKKMFYDDINKERKKRGIPNLSRIYIRE